MCRLPSGRTAPPHWPSVVIITDYVTTSVPPQAHFASTFLWIYFFPFSLLSSPWIRSVPSQTHTHTHGPTLTVAMSMEAVASSMMRMLLFLTKALARQKSCRWPWLKFSPPSVTVASAEGKTGRNASKKFQPDLCRL